MGNPKNRQLLALTTQNRPVYNILITYMHYWKLCEIKLKLNSAFGYQGCQKLRGRVAGLSKYYAASLGIFNSLKNAIRKELPSRVAGRYWPSRRQFSQAGGYFWQPWYYGKSLTISSSYIKIKFAIPTCHSQIEKPIADGCPSTLKATVIMNKVFFIKSAACCSYSWKCQWTCCYQIHWLLAWVSLERQNGVEI